MITVGVYEARTHWFELLDKVQQGETVTITRRGVVAAVLRPLTDSERREMMVELELKKQRRKAEKEEGRRRQ
jgi:prevent-host-death family protein